MFERYSEPSVRALFVARAVALAAGAQSIDVEHLLMAALEAWPDAGIRREEVARTLGVSMPNELPGPGCPQIPFSGVVQRVLNSAMWQADRFGQHRIRPEHLLLALHDESDSATAGILRQAGVDREELVRSAALGALSDDSPLEYQSRLEVELRRE
jgi:ATP-dependent Clp protease ATP-binding subunit ClpA